MYVTVEVDVVVIGGRVVAVVLDTTEFTMRVLVDVVASVVKDVEVTVATVVVRSA